MRVLIVDGHSVIFAWPEIRAMHARRTALARDAVIKALTEYQDSSGVHVVAVFDGKGARANEATEPGGIQVFYSGKDQTADDIIERLVDLGGEPAGVAGRCAEGSGAGDQEAAEEVRGAAVTAGLRLGYDFI